MKIVTESDSLANVCSRLSQAPFITVDTEFLRETTFWPKLCLIQMASSTEEVIVDPLADGIDLQPFYDLMADTSVVKVFHAARQDIEIVHHQAGVIPKPLFDTQVAAMVCGFGDSVGYENLIRQITGHQIDKTSRFTDWSRRPLTDKQLAYALADVTHLRDAYANLKQQLDGSGRAHWLAEEMAVLESPATYTTDPRDAWKRIKFKTRSKRALAVLIEISAWREREAQARDVPRNRIVKDEALQEIALQMPKQTADLDRLRAVPRGFGRSGQARDLIDAVHRGLRTDTSDLPNPRKGSEPLPQGLGPIIEMLKVALKIACDKNRVAQKLIATVSDLEKIAADDNADVPALKGWRREIFGEDALRLKHGEYCLAIEDGEAVVLPKPATATRPRLVHSAD